MLAIYAYGSRAPVRMLTTITKFIPIYNTRPWEYIHVHNNYRIHVHARTREMRVRVHEKYACGTDTQLF